MKIYELSPQQGERAKSFYGKAKVIEKENGDTVLLSYDTEVCKIDPAGSFIRLWNGYSQTTMRHINSFLSLMGIHAGGKKWWDDQKI